MRGAAEDGLLLLVAGREGVGERWDWGQQKGLPSK